MSKGRDRTVYKRDNGEWVNKRNDAKKASSVHPTQRDAERAAKGDAEEVGRRRTHHQGRQWQDPEQGYDSSRAMILSRHATANTRRSARRRLTMITVAIGPEVRSDSDISESWINQQINRRLRDGARVCVTVKIKERDLDVILRTQDCPKPRGSGREPNGAEQRVFDLWKKLDLQDGEFRGGNLVAFLKQMGRL